VKPLEEPLFPGLWLPVLVLLQGFGLVPVDDHVSPWDAGGNKPGLTAVAGTPSDPATLLQHLGRCDTSNPPGDERPCVEWIEALLAAVGFETPTYATDPDRLNHVARLSGDGDAPPLMLHGHVDVVPDDPAQLTLPPFEPVAFGTDRIFEVLERDEGRVS